MRVDDYRPNPRELAGAEKIILSIFKRTMMSSKRQFAASDIQMVLTIINEWQTQVDYFISAQQRMKEMPVQILGGNYEIC